VECTEKAMAHGFDPTAGIRASTVLVEGSKIAFKLFVKEIIERGN
jgi:hypothetical protein